MIEIIGKNGAGKSYLANKLYDLGFERNIGYTTRTMRNGEKNGVDYNFITKKEFEKCICNDEFIDYKKRNGNYYGISKKNIYPNTILVSGDSKKIEEATGYNVLKCYIDSDLLTRYSRVLQRNDSIKNTFERFHLENFSYLYDFDALFIDNNFSNNNSFNKLMQIAVNNDAGILNKYIISNRNFIKNDIDNFDLSKLVNSNDKLSVLLKFEEYILRKMFLENKSLFDDNSKIEYYCIMRNFTNSINLNSNMYDNGLTINIDNNTYKFDYKIKKKVI